MFACAQLGGRNFLMADEYAKKLPMVSDKPTIVFGAGLTHAHPGEESASMSAVRARHPSLQ